MIVIHAVTPRQKPTPDRDAFRLRSNHMNDAWSNDSFVVNTFFLTKALHEATLRFGSRLTAVVKG